jgi:hypothetical protein
MEYSALPSQRHTSKRIFYLWVFSLVILLIGGGVALLLQPHAPSQADGVSVVGPPSLPASTVNAIFTHLGSPMAGNGDVIVRASRNMQIDDAFALAVWWTETNDGEAGTGRAYGDRNPAGVRSSPGYPSDYGGYTIYPSYAAAIVYWFGMIRQRYVDRGMDTVYAISYPYVGTSSSPLWAAKVIRLMLQYRGEAPPPTAIPTINSSPTVKPSPVVSPVVPGVNKKHIRPPEVDARAFSEHTQLQPHSIQVSAEPPQAAYAGWIELSVIFLAFLVAFVLAIWALRTIRSRRVVPEPMPLRTTTSLLPLAMPGQLPVTEQLQELPLLYFAEVSDVRTTEALQGDIVAADISGGSLDTDPRLRRVTLLPSLPDRTPVTREAVTVGARPLGLLSRYREAPSEGSHDTDPHLRRVTLSPSQPGQAPVTREPVTVGARPAGLLTRYREMQQH